MRTNDEMRAGSVWPIAWNMLEPTKTTPDATKLHDTTRRYSLPTAMTPGSDEKTPIIAAAAKWQATAKTNMKAAAAPAAVLNVSRTRSECRAPKFWPATGPTANPSATTGMNPACSTRMPMPNPACAADPNGRQSVYTTNR